MKGLAALALLFGPLVAAVAWHIGAGLGLFAPPCAMTGGGCVGLDGQDRTLWPAVTVQEALYLACLVWIPVAGLGLAAYKMASELSQGWPGD